MSAEQDDQEHIHIDVLVCPLCGETNRCSYAAGHPHSECWCNRATFPEGVFDRIPAEQRRKSCICQRCLDEYADKSQPKKSHTVNNCMALLHYASSILLAGCHCSYIWLYWATACSSTG